MPPFSEPITAPAIRAGRRGLLAVATDPADVPQRWTQGVVFQPNACAVPDPFPIVPCDPGDQPDLDDDLARAAVSSWVPVLLRGYDRCSAMDGEDRAGREARARAMLEATGSHQAEAEFSDGVASGLAGDANPRLTDPAGWVNVVTTPTAAARPDVGLAELEDALGDCLHGQRGALHVRPGVAALWDAAGQMHVEGGLLVTANDNVVIVGTGYSGDEPDGTPAAAGSSWAYATALPFRLLDGVRFQGDDTAQRLDRAANTIVTWATRLSLVFTSPCCKIAAEIDTTPT